MGIVVAFVEGWKGRAEIGDGGMSGCEEIAELFPVLL